MIEPRTFVTLSKYPPYRSGHAQQAVWNNRALADLTGTVQHQVTYCGHSHDPGDSAGPDVLVHHVVTHATNSRVPDGHLNRAMSAEIVRVGVRYGVDAILTYYADPHAAAANRAQRALRQFGRRPVVVNSIEGSDVLNSMWQHTEDGEASLLIADLLDSDVFCAVSEYTAQMFLQSVERVYGAALADQAADAVRIRYPGLPPQAFVRPSEQAIRLFVESLGLDPATPVVSTVGRLAPEKGLEMVFELAGIARERQVDLQFIIAGTGPLADELLERAAGYPNVRVVKEISAEDAHCLRGASVAGIFPTRVVSGFIETFCVSALEYEAMGVPVLATDLGGVPEATPGRSYLVPVDSSAQTWWDRLTALLLSQVDSGEECAKFASAFTSEASAQRITELVATAEARTAPYRAERAGW